MRFILIHPIPAFNDNYIWILTDNDSSQAWVVDPGDAKPVLNYLEEHNLSLAGILITHHHPDHTGGVAKLKKHFNCHVAGPTHLVKIVDQGLVDGDSISVMGRKFDVIATPGHTLDHLCYFSQSQEKDNILFSGDTLFRGGCGRLFEGSPKQMQDSLQKLARLPQDTLIYCTHEYTLANYSFALSLDTNNANLIKYEQECQDLRAKNLPTLPSKISIEQEVNPFLRAHIDQVSNNAAKQLDQELGKTAEARFAQIRKAKDSF